MPELPEVETTRVSLLDKLTGHTIEAVQINQGQLRWPVPKPIQKLGGRRVLSLKRRAKYFIMELDTGQVLIHLGMSGHLKWVPEATPWAKHDHVGFKIQKHWLRLNDPRRFGAVLHQADHSDHPVLHHLGPEPLSAEFNAAWLWSQLQRRSSVVKSCIMDQKVVVGVGNIYASESLFRAKIHPEIPGNRISKEECDRLVQTIQHVLQQAIKAGGTTLRDFKDGTGKRGYFAQELQVYGREDEPCRTCQRPIEKVVIQNRSTYFCGHCQSTL